VKWENEMLTLLKRLIILLCVIGLASTAVVAIVNNTSASQALSSGQREFQPQRPTGSSAQFQSRPEFDLGRGGEGGGGSFFIIEILKNFGIMAGIICAVTVSRTLIKRFKPTRPALQS
jgi:hypothetical protein